MSDIDATPGHLVRRLHRISTAWFAEECATFGLTSVQYAALTAIRENPEVDAGREVRLLAQLVDRHEVDLHGHVGSNGAG